MLGKTHCTSPQLSTALEEFTWTGGATVHVLFIEFYLLLF